MHFKTMHYQGSFAGYRLNRNLGFGLNNLSLRRYPGNLNCKFTRHISRIELNRIFSFRFNCKIRFPADQIPEIRYPVVCIGRE